LPRPSWEIHEYETPGMSLAIRFQSPFRAAKPATTSVISPSSTMPLQKFAHFARKSLNPSSGIVNRMQIKDLRRVVARNLRFFMERETCAYRNPNSLGVACKVSPNTIRNLLDPSRRTTTSAKPEGYPTLDILEKVALKLSCEVWELLHPDIEKSIREREMYLRLEHSFKTLPSRSEKLVKQ
jgi:hypothetical protein